MALPILSLKKGLIKELGQEMKGRRVLFQSQQGDFM